VARQNGLETETFEHALELEEERGRYLPEALRYARPFPYFSRGLNAEYLMRSYDAFPRRSRSSFRESRTPAAVPARSQNGSSGSSELRRDRTLPFSSSP
jgi:hypothetical protein